MTDPRDFFLALFPEWPADVFAEVRAFPTTGGDPVQRWCRSAVDLLRQGQQLGETHEVYFGVNPRRGKRGRKENVSYVGALHLDMDIPADDARLVLEQFPLPPSAIVASGRGLHAYWLLREPFTVEGPDDIARVERITRGLAYHFPGADKGAWDSSRVLRMPSTRSHKREATVELTDFRTERRYSLSDFEEWGMDVPEGVDPAIFRDDVAADGAMAKVEASGLSQATLETITAGHAPGADRSRHDFAVCCALTRAGLTDDEIRAIFGHYPVGTKYTEPGEGDRYLALTIGKARADVKRQQDETARQRLSEQAEASANGSGPSVTPSVAVEFPEAAWHGMFSDYREAMATTEAPDAHHFGAVITAMGWLLGRRVCVTYDRKTYPNLSTVLVGKTGVTRKTGTTRRAIGTALAVEPDLPHLTAVGSAEGLLEAIATAGMSDLDRRLYDAHTKGTKTNSHGSPDKNGDVPAMPSAPPQGRRLLLAPEEWATMLSKAKQEGTGNLTPIITNLYDCPDTFNPPTRSANIKAVKPTLSILTASAPIWVEKFLTVSELISGFCNRFCYLLGEAKDPVPWPEPPRQEPLNRVKRALHETLRHWAGREHEFTLSPEAHRAWASYYALHRSRLASYAETHAAVVQRAPTFAVKIALIFAVLRNAEPVIEAEDLERATAVADYLEYCAGELLGGLGESAETELERKVLRHLAGGEHMKKSPLHRAVSGRYSSDRFNRTIEAMLKVGTIECDPGGAFFDPAAVREEAKP